MRVRFSRFDSLAIVTYSVFCVAALGGNALALVCNPEVSGIKQAKYFQSDLELTLGDGFDPDKPTARFARCLKASGNINEAITAKVDQDIQIVDKRSTLYEGNGFDISFAISNGPSGLEVAASRFSDHVASSQDFTYTVWAEVNYGSREACGLNPQTGLCQEEYPGLRDNYASLVELGKLDEFFKRCGKFWVNRVYRRSRIALVYSWNNLTATDRTNLEAGLEAWHNGGSTNSELFTSWRSVLENLNSTSRSRITLSVSGSAKVSLAAAACVTSVPAQNLGAMRDCLTKFFQQQLTDQSTGSTAAFEVLPFEITHDGVSGCYQGGIDKRDSALREIAYEVEDVEQLVKRMRNLEYEVQYGFRDPDAFVEALEDIRGQLQQYQEELDALATECFDSKATDYSECRTPSAAGLDLPTIPELILQLLADDRTWSFFRWCLEAVRGTAEVPEQRAVQAVIGNLADSTDGAFSCYRATELAKSILALTVSSEQVEDPTSETGIPLNLPLSVRPLASLKNIQALTIVGRRSDDEQFPTLSGVPALWGIAPQLEELNIQGFSADNMLDFELLAPRECDSGVKAGLACIDNDDCDDDGALCVQSTDAWPSLQEFACDDCDLADLDYEWPLGLERLSLRENRFGQMTPADITNFVTNGSFAQMVNLTRLDVRDRLPELLNPPYVYSSGSTTVRSYYELAPVNMTLVPPYYGRYWYNTPNYTWYQYCELSSTTADTPYVTVWRETSKRAEALFEAWRTVLLAQLDDGLRSEADAAAFQIVFLWGGGTLRDTPLAAATSFNALKQGYFCRDTEPVLQGCNPAAYELGLPSYPTATQTPSCHAEDGFSRGMCSCMLGLN